MHDTLKREREIFDLCIQALQALEIGDVRADKVDGPREAMIYLKGPWGTKKYVGAVKTRIVPETLGLITQQVEFLRPKTHTVLLTDYVPPKLYEGLKQNKVEFIDTAGNAYLNNPPLYVEITGRKRRQHKAGRPVRAFRPAGLKLIFVFLKKPRLLRAPYRELANRAGVAVGAVGAILQDLEQLGFIRRRTRGDLQLANWPELLERWEMGYTELLRPKLALGTFKPVGRTLEDMVLQVQNWKEDGCLIGGELAAALLTKQLRPETTILHTADDLAPTLLALKLLPDPEGNVEILRTFGNENKYEMHRGIADPVLVHVELLRHAGDRTREIAKLILEDHIAGRFQ